MCHLEILKQFTIPKPFREIIATKKERTVPFREVQSMIREDEKMLLHNFVVPGDILQSPTSRKHHL